MQDHPDTNKELSKLAVARSYLQDNGVFDKDSLMSLKKNNNGDKKR